MIRDDLSMADRRRIYEMNLGRCEECAKGLPRRGVSAVYDLITPVELGGRLSDANTQLLCEEVCYEAKEIFDLQRIMDAARRAA